MGRMRHRLAVVCTAAWLVLAAVVAAAPAEATGVRDVAAGGAHTCALHDNGTVRCWGDNRFGQLGQGDTKSRGGNPGEMGDALPPIDLGTGRTATAIAAGQSRTCALLDDHSVKCWGDNADGALGLGDAVNRGDGPGQMGDDLPAIDLGVMRLRDGVGPAVGARWDGRWRRQPAAAQLSADDRGGSGVGAIRYAIADAGEPAGDPFGPDGRDYDPAAPPTLAHGQRLRYGAVDRVGNRSVPSSTVAARVDELPPTTTDDVPAGPATGPHVVTLTATDDRSGVAEIRYAIGAEPPDPAGPDGAVYDPADRPRLRPGERIRYLAIDRAGNTEPARTATLRVPTAPTPTPPSPKPPPPAATMPAPPAANVPPTANAVVTRTTGRRARIHRFRLDASTSVDPDGRLVRYRWRLGGRTLATGVRATVRLPARRRPYRLTLTVVDDDGARGQATVSVRAPHPPPIRITLPVRILFASDSSYLTAPARRAVRRLRRHVRGAIKVTVVGHSDSWGPARYNRWMSERRARRVAAALLSGVRPRPRAVRVVGLGARRPVASNATPAGRAANRRVEIRIVTRR